MAAERQTDIRSVPVQEIQGRLAAMGAFLPNRSSGRP
jgi:hypothetical protein